MNLNPVSPFSNRTLDQLTGEHVREGDAWAAQLQGLGVVKTVAGSFEHCIVSRPGSIHASNLPRYHSGWAEAGPLMEQGDWQIAWGLYVDANGATIWDDEEIIVATRCGPLAIRNAFIIAATHAASIAAGKE